MKEFENAFWNIFKKELHKYKDCLDTIFLHYPLETINVNTTYGQVFNHFKTIILILYL